mgnify:CR=1 FL=1
MKSISMSDFYLKQQGGNISVIDVREPNEYQLGHVPGAINLPVGSLIDTFGELDETQSIYVICQTGQRSQMATAFLSSLGIDAVNVEGGTSGFPGRLAS